MVDTTHTLIRLVQECREVPGVNCYLELELVETPKCYPVPVEECDDILKVGKL